MDELLPQLQIFTVLNQVEDPHYV